ncbi:MAG TPA: GntR family transcriptional regulator [Planctomycetota bacterium]|nr:GntR family transcriptional regulator [Planctomycetota bacterium]
MESLAASLSGAIGGGEIMPGEMLPPERALAARHRVGRVTVRTALRRLVRDGLAECVPGVGYVVSRREAVPVDARPVGLIYADLGGRTLAASRSVAAIEAELARRGRALLVGASGLTAAGEDACVRRFRAAGVGALVIAPATSGGASAELGNWIRQGLPTVLEGHPGRWLLPAALSARCDQLDTDNRGGVRQALEYLWSLGHRRVAFVSSSPAEGSERCAAFTEFLRERGLPDGPELVRAGLGGADPREAGREGWRRLAAAGEQPTAVLCPNDDTALGVVEAARSAGLRCPEELSVVGFGNESVDGPAAIRELTTVDFQRDELARQVARLLEAQQAGGRGRRPEQVRLPAQLVVRKSCAAAPAAART